MYMIPKDWYISQDPKGWWLSKKIQGLRAFWDGYQLYSSQGRKLKLPNYFIQDWPITPLDGELTLNGKGSLAVNSLLKSKDENIWKQAAYEVYDLPRDERPYYLRYQKIQRFSNVSPYLKVVPQEECTGNSHLQEFLERRKTEGDSSGILLRDPEASYTSGRADCVRQYRTYEYVEVKFSTIYQHDKYGIELLCDQDNGQDVIVKCDSSAIVGQLLPGIRLLVAHEGFHSSGKIKSPYFVRINSG